MKGSAPTRVACRELSPAVAEKYSACAECEIMCYAHCEISHAAYGDMMFFASLKMMLFPLVAMMRCLPNVPSGTHHSRSEHH